MLDLYSHDSDLFIAGYASASTKASVLSFSRYHPRMKMSPFYWSDYGYIKTNTNISYYIDNQPIPKLSTTIPIIPTIPIPTPITTAANNNANVNTFKTKKSDILLKIELFRRAAKLFIHEIGHIYGLEHCVHHHCNMNGTAHLIEDFAAPSYWCGICLRKLQYRLGFDVCNRYRDILSVYNRVGMVKESKWIEERLDNIGNET